jgi:hypothetical protein
MGTPSMFSDTTFRRYYDILQCIEAPRDAAKSKNQHRLELGLLRGPIYTEKTVLRIKTALELQIDYICSKLGISRPDIQSSVYGPMDPLSQELVTVICVTIFFIYFSNLSDCIGQKTGFHTSIQRIHVEYQENQEITVSQFT